MRRTAGPVLAAFAVFALALAPGAQAKSKGKSKNASTVKVSQGATTLVPDAATFRFLTDSGFSVAPLAPARAGDAGISFPVTTGRLDRKSYAGKIRHVGGLVISRGDTRLELRNFIIKIDEAPELTALVGGARVSILDLDLGEAKVTATKRRLTVAGVKATLTQTAATAINQTFGLPADTVKAGTELGTATVKTRIAKRKR